MSHLNDAFTNDNVVRGLATQSRVSAQNTDLHRFQLPCRRGDKSYVDIETGSALWFFGRQKHLRRQDRTFLRGNFLKLRALASPFVGATLETRADTLSGLLVSTASPAHFAPFLLRISQLSISSRPEYDAVFGWCREES
jgi:hypothetical protein